MKKKNVWTAASCLLVIMMFPLMASAEANNVAEENCPDNLKINGQRQLFLDNSIINSMSGDIELRMHEAVDRGQVLRFDKPWEGPFCGYSTIIKDGDTYRLYYRGTGPIPDKFEEMEEHTCYAESSDGIVWKKPALGLYEFDGSKENNIILKTEPHTACHNFCPFLDTSPNAPPSQRYKAMGGHVTTGGLRAYCSADGIVWKPMQSEPVFQEEGWVFDSQNVPFWSDAEQCYVLFYRKVPHKVRAIAKSTSTDFIHWTTGRMMLYSDTGTDTPPYDLYTNQTHPYFRAPQIYIAAAARFMPGRQVLTHEQANRLGVHPKYFKDTSDSILMTTRPFSHMYDRTFQSALIKPGIGIRNWVSRSNYPVLNIVPTGQTEMSLYVNEDYAQPSSHINRYTYRIDGITSLSAGCEGGEMISRTFTFTGNQLSLNYATSAAGSIRIEIQDDAGRPIDGFTLADSRELIGNEIDRAYDWNQKIDVKALQDKPIRLRCVLKDADLFSFVFN